MNTERTEKVRNTESEWVGTGELSERLGISRQGTRNLMREHGVSVVTAAKKWRMRREDAEKFISEVLQMTKLQ